VRSLNIDGGRDGETKAQSGNGDNNGAKTGDDRCEQEPETCAAAAAKVGWLVAEPVAQEGWARQVERAWDERRYRQANKSMRRGLETR
jgi:hypothetical protein